MEAEEEDVQDLATNTPGEIELT